MLKNISYAHQGQGNFCLIKNTVKM